MYLPLIRINMQPDNATLLSWAQTQSDGRSVMDYMAVCCGQTLNEPMTPDDVDKLCKEYYQWVCEIPYNEQSLKSYVDNQHPSTMMTSLEKTIEPVHTNEYTHDPYTPSELYQKSKTSINSSEFEAILASLEEFLAVLMQREDYDADHPSNVQANDLVAMFENS
jgi:hypothetical protein